MSSWSIQQQGEKPRNTLNRGRCAGIELAVENVIADPAQVALNSWRTFNDSGAGIVVV